MSSLLPLDLAHDNFPTASGIVTQSRSRQLPALTPDLLWQALELPFKPKNTVTFQEAETLLEVDITRLRNCFRGVIINIFGPIIKSPEQQPDPRILQKVHEISQRMQTCLLPEKNMPLPQKLLEMHIPIADNIVPKPDPRCFLTAVHKHLPDVKPSSCVLIGSNYLTDNTCADAGLDYIHIAAQQGAESTTYRTFRSLGDLIAAFHKMVFKKKKTYPELTHHYPEYVHGTSYPLSSWTKSKLRIKVE